MAQLSTTARKMPRAGASLLVVSPIPTAPNPRCRTDDVARYRRFSLLKDRDTMSSLNPITDICIDVFCERRRSSPRVILPSPLSRNQ